MLSERQTRNYEFFMAHLPEYLADPLLAGKIGVFYDERLAQTFDTMENAARYAFSTFGEGFVIQALVDETQYVNYNRWLEVGNA